MKNSCITFFILLLTLSCNSDKLIITGKIPAAYDGNTIYLVPRPYPTAENVDSAKIRNGRFSFRIPADSVHICDITISRKANARVEKLLVVIEPGRLSVKIDTVSSAYGTPLNDELERWKEAMNEAGSRAATAINEEEKRVTYTNFGKTTFDLIMRNENPLGGYIYFIMEPLFDSLQTAKIKSSGIEKWKPVKR